MEDGEEGPKVVRAGRRARQAQLMQNEQVVDHTGDDRPGAASEIRSEQAFAPPAADGDDDDAPTQRDAGPPHPPGAPALAPPHSASGDVSASPPAKRQGFTDVGPPSDPLADDGGKKFTGVSRRKQEQQVQEKEQVAKAKSRYDEKASTAEIMDIPELEEEGKEDLTRVVAAAPKVRANKIQGLDELDEDQQYRLPATTDQDIDLSVLTAVLCSSEMVYEPDDIWDPELLLSQVAAELNESKDTGLEPHDSQPVDMWPPMT